MLRGRTDQSQFVMPLLHVRSVSEEIVGALYSGYGKTFFLPGIMRYISMLVSPSLNFATRERQNVADIKAERRAGMDVAAC